jgi:glycine/D-amino acid oxidase-like deaminating enzyme
VSGASSTVWEGPGSSRVVADAEVVIVGAGAVGTSIAYFLARRGVDTILVDKGPVCGETSGATVALIWVQTKTPTHYTRLSLLSADLYPVVVRALDDDVEYARPGGLRLATSEHEMNEAVQLAEHQRREAGLVIEVLDGDAVRRLEPAVGPAVVGGVYCPADGHINSLLYVHALARLAQRHGVRLFPFTPLLSIMRDAHGAVSGVVTPEGIIRARAVVNAAGVMASVVAAMVGVRVPIIPCRGQVVITEPLPPLITRPFHILRQSPRSGIFLCGETGDFVGLDRTVTPDAIRSVAQRVVRLLPALAKAQVLRSFAGLRPWPPDGLPFLGPVSSVPGFYVAVGHSGITLSPAYGKVISDLIVDGRTDVPIEPYNPCRFDGREEIVFTRGASRRVVYMNGDSWLVQVLSR